MSIFFWRKPEPEFDWRNDLECIGMKLDNALETYSDLLDNSCRDAIVMDAAWERVNDLREHYRKAKEAKHD